MILVKMKEPAETCLGRKVNDAVACWPWPWFAQWPRQVQHVRPTLAVPALSLAGKCCPSGQGVTLDCCSANAANNSAGQAAPANSACSTIPSCAAAGFLRGTTILTMMGRCFTVVWRLLQALLFLDPVLQRPWHWAIFHRLGPGTNPGRHRVEWDVCSQNQRDADTW